jgi:phage terminase large subunit
MADAAGRKAAARGNAAGKGIARIEIVIPYRPRPAFVAYHGRAERWAVMVCHRRAGKTVAAINELICRALTCKRPKPRTAYIAPLFKQAKALAWEYLKQYGLVVPGAAAHESELRLDFPNGGRVRLYGADNPDALRGLYLDEVVLDEYAQMRGSLWSEVIRPALADRQGGATFIGTPMGRNGFCELWERARGDAGWFALMLKASDSGLIPEAELAAARAEMTADQYAQEFECAFDAAVVGSYYGALLQQAETEGRIAGVPWDPALPVHTAWDLGIGDSTAIWFFQQAGLEIHVIDYHENSGVGLGHYVGELEARRGRGWVFGEHVLPHDARARELSTGRSREQALCALGLVPRILPAEPVEDGINAVRMLLPRCWFDAARCARGIEALRQYRRDYDERLKAFKGRPLHDWTSHAADALRYLAMGLPEKAAPQKPIHYPKGPFI